MIGYVTFGTNRLTEALAFYDALLEPVGASRIMEFPTGAAVYGTSWDTACFAITPPWDGRPATVGNGTMAAFKMPSRAGVDAFHARALTLGATNEGEPGLRSPDGPTAFYGAYVRDLDGNKLCAYRSGPAD